MICIEYQSTRMVRDFNKQNDQLCEIRDNLEPQE